MKRIAFVCLALTILLGADGVYMTIAHYGGSDQASSHGLSDGTTVLIAAGILLVVTIMAFVMSRRSARQPSARQR